MNDGCNFFSVVVVAGDEANHPPIMSLGTNVSSLGAVYHDCTIRAVCTNTGKGNRCTYEQKVYGSPSQFTSMHYRMNQHRKQPQHVETFTNDTSNTLYSYGTLVGGNGPAFQRAVGNGKNEIHFSYPKALEKNSFCGMFFPNKSTHA